MKVDTPPLKEVIADWISDNMIWFVIAAAVACIVGLTLMVAAVEPEPAKPATYTKTHHHYNEHCINGVVYYQRINAYFPALQRNGLPYPCGDAP